MTLGALKKYCKKYITNPSFVYKSCCKEWIVILEKMEDTMTNEQRSNVSNHLHASFRGNKFRVANIIHKFNLQQIPMIENSYFVANKLLYKVGEIILSNAYDPDINHISSNGIHYFLTIDTAYYFELDELKTYSGMFINWFPNGNIRCVRNYISGLKSAGIELNEWFNNTFINYQYDIKSQKVYKIITNEYNKTVYFTEAVLIH